MNIWQNQAKPTESMDFFGILMVVFTDRNIDCPCPVSSYFRYDGNYQKYIFGANSFSLKVESGIIWILQDSSFFPEMEVVSSSNIIASEMINLNLYPNY